MKAFVEVLSAIVRVGPSADRYGEPFEFAVGASSVDGKTAVVKALVSKGNFTRAHAAAIIRALRSKIPGFNRVVWDRVKLPQETAL